MSNQALYLNQGIEKATYFLSLLLKNAPSNAPSNPFAAGNAWPTFGSTNDAYNYVASTGNSETGNAAPTDDGTDLWNKAGSIAYAGKAGSTGASCSTYVGTVGRSAAGCAGAAGKTTGMLFLLLMEMTQ